MDGDTSHPLVEELREAKETIGGLSSNPSQNIYCRNIEAHALREE
jgi:hypothetical protein